MFSATFKDKVKTLVEVTLNKPNILTLKVLIVFLFI